MLLLCRFDSCADAVLVGKSLTLGIVDDLEAGKYALGLERRSVEHTLGCDLEILERDVALAQQAHSRQTRTLGCRTEQKSLRIEVFGLYRATWLKLAVF